MAKHAPPLAGRLVPLAAVAAANCVNIPLMRITELKNGIDLQNEKGQHVGNSCKAAREAISSVILSRILMSAPSMSMYHLKNHLKHAFFKLKTIFLKPQDFLDKFYPKFSSN